MLLILKDDDPVDKPQSQCDCIGGDCACSLPEVTLTALGLDTLEEPDQRDWVKAPELSRIPLDERFAVHFGPHSKLAVLSDGAESLLDGFQQPATLEESLARSSQKWEPASIRRTLEELRQLRMIVPRDLLPCSFTEIASTLSAWLHVTDRCNLRCAYCYLPHHRKDMSLEVGRASIESVVRSACIHNYSRIRLKFAGGEPLIRFETLVALQEHAIQAARAAGIELDSIVLSNGTLIDDTKLKRMQTLGLRLMISLDGIGSRHDAQRFYSGGRGTFRDVERGIELALDYGIVPDISVTVTGRNAPGLPSLVEWLLERNLPFGLNFYRENDFSQSLSDLQLEEKRIIEGMLAAFAILERNLPSRSMLASLVDRADLSSAHVRTCGVGRDYMVFDYRGGISKCQMQLASTVTDVYEHDPLSVIRDDREGLQNLPVQQKSICQQCQWKYWCTGGCPLLTYRATGRYDLHSPNCNIYTALYPSAVRLEGLRLLKYMMPA